MADSNSDSVKCVCCQNGRHICDLSDVIDNSADLFDSFESNSKVERSPDDIFTSFELRLSDESMHHISHDVKVLTCY